MKRAAVAAMLLVFIVPAVIVAADGFKREGTGEKRANKDALEGKTPPEFQVTGWENTDGKSLALKQFKGKVVVIDFWGTWCGPCRAAMPHLKKLYEKHKDDGLVVIGIHTTRYGERMADYVKESDDIVWPVAVDVDRKTITAFRVDSFPDYYLIDRAGNLRVADLANGDLDRAVEVLLKEDASDK